MNALSQIAPACDNLAARAAEYEAACAIVTARYGARPAPGKWGFNHLGMTPEETTRRFNAAMDATDACQAWDRRVRDVLAGGLGK